jgi:hypothetical protein
MTPHHPPPPLYAAQILRGIAVHSLQTIDPSIHTRYSPLGILTKTGTLEVLIY